MNERGGILSLIAEIRGRLDELEMLVQASPRGVVPTPAFFDEPGVVDLTPAAAVEFPVTGLAAPVTAAPGEAVLPYFRMRAPDPAVRVEVESFELSDLHRQGAETRYGFMVQPAGQPQPWMVYEFIREGDDLLAYEWTEWVVKASVPDAATMNLYFTVYGAGFAERIRMDKVRVGEFSSFVHARLTNQVLRDRLNGRQMSGVRLEFGTEGKLIPLRVYNFSLFGKPVVQEKG